MSYWKLLNVAVKKDSAKPFYTWIGEAGRIELSGATFLNSVSKASNFLIDGLELEPPASVEVHLGNHWQSPVWLGAALSTGMTISDNSGDFRFSSLDQIDENLTEMSRFVAISKHPFGVPDKSLPNECIDGSTEVRNFGDLFTPDIVKSDDSNVVSSQGKEFTWHEIENLCEELLEKFGISPGESFGILGTADLATVIALQVAIPVIHSNQVVLIEQLDADIDSICAQEKLSRIIHLD